MRVRPVAIGDPEVPSDGRGRTDDEEMSLPSGDEATAVSPGRSVSLVLMPRGTFARQIRPGRREVDPGPIL